MSIRKDVDTKGFKFPEKIPLKTRLKDVLEANVPESYYLPQTTVDKFCERYKQSLARDVSNTIRCGGRGSYTIKHSWDIVVEPLCCASRGRNPNNPSDRTAGVPTEQRLEINTRGVSNTLTTVQKDNTILENQRIRKMTPRECWRLMGVKDQQFDKLHDICNTQLYKLAGNSIVVNVLEAVFRSLLIND